MFVVALTIRLVIALQGIHGTDILAHIEGAKSLLLTGSPYCAAQYVYPPLYAALQLSSILAFGWNLLGYKFMPVLFDSATSLMMYVAVRKFTRSERLALVSQALWALNPLAVVASAWYGLFDSIPTLFALASLLALLSSRPLASASLLALGVTSKVFPAAYLLPQALHPRNERLKGVAKYVAVATAVSLVVWLALSARCLGRALELQLRTHLERLDKGLSLVPCTPYSSIMTLAVPTLVLTMATAWMRVRGGFRDEDYLGWAGYVHGADDSLELLRLPALPDMATAPGDDIPRLQVREERGGAGGHLHNGLLRDRHGILEVLQGSYGGVVARRGAVRRLGLLGGAGSSGRGEEGSRKAFEG
jgi:hypothetical protein